MDEITEEALKQLEELEENYKQTIKKYEEKWGEINEEITKLEKLKETLRIQRDIIDTLYEAEKESINTQVVRKLMKLQ